MSNSPYKSNLLFCLVLRNLPQARHNMGTLSLISSKFTLQHWQCDNVLPCVFLALSQIFCVQMTNSDFCESGSCRNLFDIRLCRRKTVLIKISQNFLCEIFFRIPDLKIRIQIHKRNHRWLYCNFEGKWKLSALLGLCCYFSLYSYFACIQ